MLRTAAEVSFVATHARLYSTRAMVVALSCRWSGKQGEILNEKRMLERGKEKRRERVGEADGREGGRR